MKSNLYSQNVEKNYPIHMLVLHQIALLSALYRSFQPPSRRPAGVSAGAYHKRPMAYHLYQTAASLCSPRKNL